MADNLKTWPEKIWLAYHEDKEAGVPPYDPPGHDIDWRVSATLRGVEYIRAEVVDEWLLAVAEAARAEAQKVCQQESDKYYKKYLDLTSGFGSAMRNIGMISALSYCQALVGCIDINLIINEVKEKP